VAASRSYTALAITLVAAGFGYGMLNPTSTKAVISWFPVRQRATVVGLKQVGLPFGGAVGAALLPLIALALGWRLAITAAALGLGVTAVALALFYRDPPVAPVPRGTSSPLREVLF